MSDRSGNDENGGGVFQKPKSDSSRRVQSGGWHIPNGAVVTQKDLEKAEKAEAETIEIDLEKE